MLLANAGLPMLVIQWPLMTLLLLPVIVLEAFLVRDLLAIPLPSAITGMAKANLLSTAVGIPVAWVATLILEVATMFPLAIVAHHWSWDLQSPAMGIAAVLLGPAWLQDSNAVWVVPGAVTILLVPCFFASVWLERKSCLRSWPEVDPLKVERAVFRSNLASYGMLVLLATGWIVAACLTGKIWIVTG